VIAALLLGVAVVTAWASGAFDAGSPPATPGADHAPTPREIREPAPADRQEAHRDAGREDRSWVDKRALAARVDQIAASTDAEVGVAVEALDDDSPVAVGGLQSAPAWSTMKVPVILARYRLAGDAPAGLADRVAAAITESDNEAAESLFEEIVAVKGGVGPASAYVQQGLEEAGDSKTVVNTVPPPGGFSTYGQTRWSLGRGLRFYSALFRGCLAPPDAAAMILKLMGEISPSQRWGLGQASFPDARQVLFKGGWGPDPKGRYLVRQFGIVETTSGGLAVGLMDMPADGQFASGVAVLDQLADAVARSTRPDRARSGPC